MWKKSHLKLSKAIGKCACVYQNVTAQHRLSDSELTLQCAANSNVPALLHEHTLRYWLPKSGIMTKERVHSRPVLSFPGRKQTLEISPFKSKNKTQKYFFMRIFAIKGVRTCVMQREQVNREDNCACNHNTRWTSRVWGRAQDMTPHLLQASTKPFKSQDQH